MNRRRDNVLLGWSTSCLAVALLAAVVCIAAGEPYREAARADASARAPDAACEQWFGTAVVLVVCGGQTSGDFRVSGGEGRGFALLASLGNGLLRGDVISAGERVLISGRATRSSHLAVLIVDSSGRPSIASFDRLGLESGGRAVLEVRGRSGAPSFRLRKPGGAVVAPTRIGPFSDRRYVAGLRVERRGKRLNVTFVAPARLAEVREIGPEGAEELWKEGELEDVLVFKTIRTSPGKRVTLSLPAADEAELVFVRPLASSGYVLPAVAKIPSPR